MFAFASTRWLLGMAAPANISDALLAEYASRLDSSLILAIAAEIDPTSQASKDEARSTLTALADAASDLGDAHDYVQPASNSATLPQQSNGNGHHADLRIDDTDGTSSIEDKSVDTAPSTVTTTTATSSVTGQTSPPSVDEDAVDRAFKEWTLGEQDDGDPHSPGYPKQPFVGSPDFVHMASDAISFLKTLFPKRERIELQLALEDAGQDIEVGFCRSSIRSLLLTHSFQAAIETLLTEELLIREEEEYESLLMQAADEMNGTQRSKKHRQASLARSDCARRLIDRPLQRIRKPGKQTVSLTSTPRGLALQTADGNGHADIKAPVDRPNVWAQTDSTVLYLATLLSVPAGALSSLFYQNSNSLPLAISKILDNAEETFDSIEDGEAKVAELKTLFPDKPNSTFRRCLCATSGDVNKAIELVRTIEDVYAREGTPLAHGLLLGVTAADKAKNNALHKSNGAGPVLTPVLPKRLPNGAFERPPSSQDCLILANTLRVKRDDAYRSAARTWQTKNQVGSSGVAAYWADHGRQLDKQAREWELRAARATVDERRKQARSLQSVDLHGLTVQQALTVTSECLTAWWACECAITGSAALR